MIMKVNENNKLIVKNSIYMYVRMIFTVLIGLYTSRMILSSLGFEDYGLYNVIGGIVALLGFVNGSMSNTTSRYITFNLGKNNISHLIEVFSTSFYIHVAIAVVIVVLSETLGLWYVYNKLVVPPHRLTAAIYLYQFSVISSVISIISIPFNASIIAHERISAFAMFAIVEALLKMGIAISLKYIPVDRLIYYGAMILFLQVSVNVAYWIYNFKNFEGIRIKLVFSKVLFREMFAFTGWNLFGNFSHVFFTQGVNLILNFYCGTAVNAARGIAIQVDNLVRQFATNLQTAVNPQIIKSYAQGDTERFFTLIFTSSRYCFYLLFLIALPIMLEAEFLLTVWLGQFPNHTISFIRITLMIVVLESLVTPMFIANLASGKVKIYQIVMCVISLAFIPITLFAIKFTGIPEIVFVSTLLMTIVEIIARIFIVHHQVSLPRLEYVKKVILNIILVIVISSVLPIMLHFILPYGILRFLSVGALSVLSVGGTIYFIGMSSQERSYMKTFIFSKLRLRIE